MKKINNKFRNNNNIYSLNYKFDSICSAGKFSGTALELIKKYNELAKEAHSNGDYVEMEVFRQYAEHYRKIVTEINERKNMMRDNNQSAENQPKEENSESSQTSEVVETAEQNTETKNTEQAVTEEQNPETEPKVRKRRSFKIVDLNQTQENETKQDDVPAEGENSEEKPKAKRVVRRRTKTTEE